MHSLTYDAGTRKVSGVRVIDAKTKVASEYKARIYFLNASTLESTRILLNSATTEFPDGLCNGSGELGHNLMDHHMGARRQRHNTQATKTKSRSAIAPTEFTFRDSRNVKTKEKDFVRGYGYQGGGSREGWARGTTMAGIGVDFKNSLKAPGPWRMERLGGFGESACRITPNYVSINKEKLDAWGIPTLNIDCKWGDNERTMSKDIAIQAAEMLAASGAREIGVYQDISAPGLGIHEMGTARMGRDPKTSVLNAHNQAHDAKNLFMTDGACMVSAACVNPSLTYMALTARACDFAVTSMKKNEL